MARWHLHSCLVAAAAWAFLIGLFIAGASAGDRLLLSVVSRADETQQPAYLILPDGYDQRASSGAIPLVVSLHTWSGDYQQRNEPLEAAVNERGWLYLFPNFRGRNDHPEACGSLLAQQDILDAVDQVVRDYPVDRRRIYLTGTSGGGHMTMLMAGRYPQAWTAASAWVGLSDLAAWHETQADENYGRMLRACCGGAPGASPAVDAEYRQRSPLTFLSQAVGLPLDLAAGVHDGHQGSVPIRHTLDAFNCVAAAQAAEVISEEEIAQLSRPQGRLVAPRPSDRVDDASFGREIHLRRQAGPARVTIFEGGHEDIASATIAWFAEHVSPAPLENEVWQGAANRGE